MDSKKYTAQEQWNSKNKERVALNKKLYAKKNKVKVRKYIREYHQKLRITVLEHYGGKCVCCGETNFAFLTIDHINGGGNQHKHN